MTDPKKSCLVGLGALIVLSRLPLLFSGYGADGDAWRVAYVAHRFWTSGTYEMSRPPGYPAHEILSAPLVSLGGAFLSNLFTLIASVAALFVFHAIARTRSQRPTMLTAAFAFAPLFWMNSATTMDYVWSLLAILFALHALLNHRLLLGGIMAGLALGFRPTNAVMLIPFGVLLLLTSPPCSPSPDRRGGRGVRSLHTGFLAFLLSSFITAGVLFLPVFLTYGFFGWLAELRGQYGLTALSSGDALLLSSYRMVYAIGPLAVASIVWIATRKGAVAQAWMSREPIFISSTVALCVLAFSFAFFPFEKSYWLAGLPFLLLVLDKLATTRALAFFTILLVCFGFVNPDVIRHSGARGTPGFNIHAGLVIEEWQKRRELEEWRVQLASIEVPGRTVVMTGVGPAFWFENDGVEWVDTSIVKEVNDVVVQRRGDPLVLYVPMIPRAEAERMESLGWKVVSDAKHREYIERTMGYRTNSEL